ncbi:MAG: biopolymer transporter ExbD [Paucibacter sp.]|nr:biopolymer transporter ExbD [Roseateles sp.]
MKVQDEAKPYDTINVTPMLDLAYVLLVIFILMTTASVAGLKIDLPKPSNKPATTEKKEIRIIQILSGGDLMLNGAAISMGELESRLAAAQSRDPETSVVIKGDPQTDYAKVVDIIDLMARLNISNVGLVTARMGT